MYTSIYLSIYLSISLSLSLYIYIYIYIGGLGVQAAKLPTVSFHNFKSQNFKLSVSNPKSKHVAYVSVLSRISNCQSLGRKKRFKILKTDRIQMSR